MRTRHYAPCPFWRVLLASVRLFRRLEQEVAAKLGFTCHYDMELNISKWNNDHSLTGDRL